MGVNQRLKKPTASADHFSLKEWRNRWIILMVACFVVFMGCSEPAPTLNPVKSIEVADFTKMIGEDGFTGIVVIVASWCPPCKKELPELVELYEKYQEKGIRIVALSIDDGGPAAIQPLINRLQVPFPVYWAGRPAVQAFQIPGIPTAIIIKKGIMISRQTGQQSRSAFERQIEALLKQ